MSHYIFIYILMSTNSALDLSIWTSRLWGILSKGRVFFALRDLHHVLTHRLPKKFLFLFLSVFICVHQSSSVVKI